jgi:hypothetical protein
MDHLGVGLREVVDGVENRAGGIVRCLHLEVPKLWEENRELLAAGDRGQSNCSHAETSEGIRREGDGGEREEKEVVK